MELGFAVEGKTRDYIVLVIEERGKVCSDDKRKVCSPWNVKEDNRANTD
jgi:hypothetical protein